MKITDFQIATTKRIVDLFTRLGQKRVLLADEVGLGKTIVARHVIDALSEWYNKQLSKKNFNVVYICSNINIANQNVEKLTDLPPMDVSDSRLSMLHLKLFNSDYESATKCKTTLIPLTPETSFVSSGAGTLNERALMFVFLRKLDKFKHVSGKLSNLLRYKVTKLTSWRKAIANYEHKIIETNRKSDKKYINLIVDELQKLLTNELSEQILYLCQKENITHNKEITNCIRELRELFARVSVNLLNADLVIMDEFQRFVTLIKAEQSEQSILVSSFFQNPDLKILLMSATPYKSYATLQELDTAEMADPYTDFMSIMNFLLPTEKYREFVNVWSKYTDELLLSRSSGKVNQELKAQAEDILYSAICRTERPNYGVVNDENVKSITITESDINAYINIEKFIVTLKKITAKDIRNIPVEYVKSAPYLLTFMDNYLPKIQIHNSLQEYNARSKVRKLRLDNLALRTSDVSSYKRIAPNNARLDAFTKDLFGTDSQDISVSQLLWIPASNPYYETQGIFSKHSYFSKYIIFSNWALVPRLLSIYLSYETERQTIGKILHTEGYEDMGYFKNDDERRFGGAKLSTDAANLLSFASTYLAKVYNPHEYYGQKEAIIRAIIKKDISAFLNTLVKRGAKWTRKGGTPQLLKLLQCIEDKNNDIENVSIPIDAPITLANMAIASPGVCLMRIFKDKTCAENVATQLVNMFNKPEAIGIISSLYNTRKIEIFYKQVIDYCIKGNLQSVLDEYAHMVDKKGKALADAMIEGFMATSNLQVDSYESLTEIKKSKMYMRTHFAVGYFINKINDQQAIRTDKIRHAFNSPFRPFVLATTSIGQEGLDFHRYCRKVVHWNLPYNPITLEQREGRINRYKNIAIRANLAIKYGNLMDWNKIFDAASEELKTQYSDIIPYWSLPPEFNQVKIERFIYMYPYSRDEIIYKQLLDQLTMYRLTLGQPRQEDLVNYLKESGISSSDAKALLFNLSPFNRI
ncbi:MAG: DEAD/DEAH box helicase family protein [Marinifilaceae bacterium]